MNLAGFKLHDFGKQNYFRAFVILIFIFGALLRLVRLEQIPQGLYFDEILYGLDGYSILKTGRDIYGHFMPLAFQSSGYYPPLYPYALVPFLALFGLSAWVVRLPAALAGIATVIFFFLLVKETAVKSSKFLALCGTLVLTLLPWHIHLSRVSFLANFGLAFLIGGTYFLVKGKHSKSSFILGTLLMAISTQAHYGYKLIAPVIFIGICIFESNVILEIKSVVSVFMARFSTGRLRKNQDFFARIKYLMNSGSTKTPALVFLKKRKVPILASVLIWIATAVLGIISYSKYNAGFRVSELSDRNIFSIILEYFRSFSLNYFFFKGDQYRLNNPWGVGQLPLILLPYILLGVLGISKQNKTVKIIVGSFLFVSPIPSAIAGLGQHSVRNSPMIIPLVFLAAIGANLLLTLSKNKKAVALLIFVSLIIFLVDIFGKLEYLFGKYGSDYADLWGSNQRAAVAFADKSQVQTRVFIDSYNVILSYFAFVHKTPPVLLQKSILMPITVFGLPAKTVDGYLFLSTEEGFNHEYWQNLPANILIVDTVFYSDSTSFKTVTSGNKNIFQYFKTE